MDKTILLAPTLDAVIVALCADYERRERELREGNISYRVEMEYKYLNYKMLDAACEIVGCDYARTLISEIGTRLGYAKCADYEYSERIYKERKLETKSNIARKLMLRD